MTVKEQIIEKIEKMDEAELAEIYKIVEEFEEKKSVPSLMEKLRCIKISAEPDLSQKATLYPIVERDAE